MNNMKLYFMYCGLVCLLAVGFVRLKLITTLNPIEYQPTPSEYILVASTNNDIQSFTYILNPNFKVSHFAATNRVLIQDETNNTITTINNVSYLTFGPRTIER